MATNTVLASGTLISQRYQIVRAIAPSGMGAVYEAADERLSGRRCAVKVLLNAGMAPQEEAEAAAWFAREAQILSGLRHPLIPTISDIFSDQGQHYLVTTDELYWPPVCACCCRGADTAFIVDYRRESAHDPNRNLEALVSVGAVPYVPFKFNTTEGPELWRLYHFYKFNRDTFLTHYHKRSNVETTFSMVKAKFGDALRSKTHRHTRHKSMRRYARCSVSTFVCWSRRYTSWGLNRRFG